MMLVAVTLAVPAAAADKSPTPKDWLRRAPDAVATSKGVEIPETDYYIVGLTHVWTAVSRLEATSVIELTPELAQFYTGHYYKPPARKKIFLVRGLFANETGRHFLALHGDSLLVSHGSLGHSFTPNFSPMIVHLDRPPKEVYISISGAQ